MSTLPVVEQILREVEVPVSVREIVERAGGRLPTKSKTPDTVVARDLSMDIKKKGDLSAFVRTSPGRYTMRELCTKEGVPLKLRDSSTGQAVWNPEAMARPAETVAEEVAPAMAVAPAPEPYLIEQCEPTPVLASAMVQDRAAAKSAPAAVPPIAHEKQTMPV
jgi:hypothetical protein